MTSPFRHTDKAFEPFFTEKVSVRTNDGKRTSVLYAAVFTTGQAEPLAGDDMLDTEREDMTFVFRKREWPFIQQLERGATIKIMSSQNEYVVSSARLDNYLGCCVTAREK